MIRKLKALGLALVAICALSALAASSASAVTHITSAKYPQHLTGEDIGAADKFIIPEQPPLICEDETYTADLTEARTFLDFTPSYVGCKTENAAFNDITVTHNGCKFRFTTVGHIKTDEDTIQVSIVGCTQHAGKATSIEIHHYASAAKHLAGESKCTNTVGEQTAQHHLIATSETAKNDIVIHGTVTVSMQTHGACSLGFTLNKTAEFVASDTVFATSGERIHIGTVKT